MSMRQRVLEARASRAGTDPIERWLIAVPVGDPSQDLLTVDVSSLVTLVHLAEYYGTTVLVQRHGEFGHTYTVLGERVRFRFRSGTHPAEEAQAAADGHATQHHRPLTDRLRSLRERQHGLIHNEGFACPTPPLCAWDEHPAPTVRLVRL